MLWPALSVRFRWAAEICCSTPMSENKCFKNAEFIMDTLSHITFFSGPNIWTHISITKEVANELSNLFSV